MDQNQESLYSAVTSTMFFLDWGGLSRAEFMMISSSYHGVSTNTTTIKGLDFCLTLMMWFKQLASEPRLSFPGVGQ